MTNIRWAVMIVTMLVFLVMVNSGIVGLEAQLTNGQVVYMELAPVDPRSLIQGDYMALDYAIEREAQNNGLNEQYRGQIVATLDERQVAEFARLYQGETLASNEILMNFYTLGYSSVVIGIDGFLFQEGLASVYGEAEYAEVRVGADGVVMLVDMVDDNLQPLGKSSD